MITGAISDGVHRITMRVYYEDTDFSGYVYHANYLKFCERARSDMIRLAGVDQNALFAEGQAIVIRRMVCEFLRPARFDDVLVVESRVAGATGVRMEMAQKVMRGEEVLFEAQVTAVVIDRNGRPIRLPEAFRVALGDSGNSIDNLVL
jgi:acyl-CoA thioester hydrolase